MFDQLVRRWWIVAARGVVGVLFGIAAFIAPERTLATLVSLFGLFALADGVFTAGAGLAVNWLSLFLEGIVGGAVGFLTLFFPASAQLWFGILIAAWAFTTGALEVAGAIGLRQVVRGSMVRGEWLLGLTGALSLLLGVLVAIRPDAVTDLFNWTIGGYAIVSGVMLMALAVNIRHWTTTATAA